LPCIPSLSLFIKDCILWVKLQKVDDIFENMPDDSLYVLRCCGDMVDSEFAQKTDNLFSKYYEQRGTKELYLYGSICHR